MVHRDDEFDETHTGMRQQNMTTKGWEVYVRWKDVSTDWIALKDLKQSNPIEPSYFARLHGIHEGPIFSWWVPYVESKRKSIISKFKSNYW